MTARPEVPAPELSLAMQLVGVAVYLERHGELPTTAEHVHRIARQVAALEAGSCFATANEVTECETPAPAGEVGELAAWLEIGEQYPRAYDREGANYGRGVPPVPRPPNAAATVRALATQAREAEGLRAEVERYWHDIGAADNAIGDAGGDLLTEDDPTPLAGAIRRLAAERDTLRADLVAAAGECLVPAPEPGSDLARVLVANRLLCRDRDALRARVAELEGDRGRLDWLSAGNCAESSPAGYAVWSGALDRDFKASDLRVALDTAMAAVRAAETGGDDAHP